MQVPFGVVRERDGHIDAIEEKPLQRFVVMPASAVAARAGADAARAAPWTCRRSSSR
ncbi:MAG: hypothetical protein U1F49_02710 [Rubrivivax sp.]